MASSLTNQTAKLSPTIESKLDELRGLLKSYVVRQSIALMIIWGVAVFWIGGLVDYLPVQVGASETPKWVRAAMLSIMIAGPLWLVVFRMLPRLLRRLPSRSLALLFERRFPQLNSSLVTAVELVGEQPRDVSNQAAYNQMLSSAHAEAEERIATVEPSELLSWTPLRMTLTGAAVLVVASIGIAVANPNWVKHWSSRLFALSDAPWPRKAALRADGVVLAVPQFTGQLGEARITLPFVDGEVKVPMGAEALLQISADTTAESVPEVCTIFYSSETGNRGRANLRRVGSPVDSWQGFNIDGPPMNGITSSLELDVVGLDARLRDLKLSVVAPAAVAGMKVRCEYPEYLLASLEGAARSRADVELLPYRSGLQIPEGTRIALTGTGSCDLSHVEYVLVSANPDPSGATDDSAATDEPKIQRVEATGNSFEIPLGVMTQNQVVEIRLVDSHGLPAELIPRYVLNVLPDTVPDVQSRLAGIGSAITANAVLPVRGSVADDNGLASTVAELTLGETASATVPLSVNDDRLESDLDLALLAEQDTLNPAPGQTLSLTVTASDFYDLLPDPHTGSSRPIQLNVVTKDELLVLLDRQELEQRKRMEQVYFELEQLRDVLESTKLLIEQASVEQASLEKSISEQTDAAAAAKSQSRMASIKAQQSVLQGDKSQQDLTTLSAQIENLRQQLVNNRVDSVDRQDRLLDKVRQPLDDLLQTDYAQLQIALQALLKETTKGGGEPEVDQSLRLISNVLVRLAEIRDNMLDMESFNEIIDLVRGLVDEQDTLLEETQAEQRKRILDLLK
ncbi:MAG: polyketide synthase [Aureliella sp.]